MCEPPYGVQFLKSKLNGHGDSPKQEKDLKNETFVGYDK